MRRDAHRTFAKSIIDAKRDELAPAGETVIGVGVAPLFEFFFWLGAHVIIFFRAALNACSDSSARSAIQIIHFSSACICESAQITQATLTSRPHVSQRLVEPPSGT
jgi:hypothetical protein